MTAKAKATKLAAKVKVLKAELTDMEARFNVEKDAKNFAYAFILSNGSLEAYRSFLQATQGISNPHALCVELIAEMAGA